MSNKPNPFASMVNTLQDSAHKVIVNLEQYQEFQKCWIFTALEGKRFGQAFCEHFNIPMGTPLYFFKDNNISERWIKDNYLV